MNVIKSLQDKYGYAPEWRDDQEFVHDLWKDAFERLVNILAEHLEESDVGDPVGVAEEEAHEVFAWAWYSYKERQSSTV